MKPYKLNAHSTAVSPGSYVLVLSDDMRKAIAAAQAAGHPVMWGTSIPMREASAEETLIEA